HGGTIPPAVRQGQGHAVGSHRSGGHGYGCATQLDQSELGFRLGRASARPVCSQRTREVMETVNSRKKAELMALPFSWGQALTSWKPPVRSSIFSIIYIMRISLGCFPRRGRSYRKPGIPAELPNQAAITG